MGKADSIGRNGAVICPLSPAILTGIGAIQLAIVLALFDLRLAALPPLVFVLLCAAAPFFPRFGFFLPSISHGGRSRNEVSLTFDDGPDPATTPALLDLLERRGARACFYVIGEKAAAHPGLIRRILEGGHELGNHSMRHDPILSLRSRAALEREIDGCQAVLLEQGIRANTFRPPAGIVNPRMWRPSIERGLACVVYGVKGNDRGNRRIAGLAKRILRKVRPGDIVLLHDRTPESATVEEWLGEVSMILDGLAAGGLGVAPLSALLRRPVMEPADRRVKGPVSAFYDGLAAQYDEEQEGPGSRSLRQSERDAVLGTLDEIAEPQWRVLEIGAGTGRFTIPLAARVKEVVAVDVSAEMIRRLESKAGEAGLTNIRSIAGGLFAAEDGQTFDMICSFSAFEYVADLDACLRDAADHLAPGGVLYFTTAHRSVFRFFTQVGNAMRQGIWLRARSRGEVAISLNTAGFESIRMRLHGPSFLPGGGMLLDVLARKT